MRISFIAGAVVAAAAAYGFYGNTAFRADAPVAIPDAAPGKADSDPRVINSNVVAFTTGDEAMNAAKDKARATLPRFRELIASGMDATYTVKFPLTLNGATEHIWMQLVDANDHEFTGLLANTPVNGTKYKMGDRMTVAANEVEDWMVRTSDVMYGGYTARVALEEMPKEEADKYRSMFRD